MLRLPVSSAQANAAIIHSLSPGKILGVSFPGTLRLVRVIVMKLPSEKDFSVVLVCRLPTREW